MQPYQSYVNTMIQAPTPQYPDRYFVLERLLGDGGEGAVYLAKQSKGYPEKVALKLQSSTKGDEQYFLENIIKYQNTYENPQSNQYYQTFIIRIHEIFNWNNKVVIVMEVGKTNLFEYLKQNTRLDLNEKGIICQQISKSIQLLHYLGFAHRDIKPENYIQVSNEWKLCDFGLTKNHQTLKTKNIGSIQYTAPEVLNESGTYSNKVDIWSLGVVFYEIIEGKELFPGTNRESVKELILKSKDYIQEKLNQLKISENWRKALLNMLQQDPSQRCSADEFVQVITGYSINVLPNNYNNQNKSQPVNHQVNVFATGIQNNFYQQQAYNQKIQIYPKPEQRNIDPIKKPDSVTQSMQKQSENQLKPKENEQVQQENKIEAPAVSVISQSGAKCSIDQCVNNDQQIKRIEISSAFPFGDNQKNQLSQQKASQLKGQNDFSQGQQINQALINFTQQGTVSQNQNNISLGQASELQQLQHQQQQSIQKNQQSDPIGFNQKQEGQPNGASNNQQYQESNNNQLHQQSEAASQLPQIQQNTSIQQLSNQQVQQTIEQTPTPIAQTQENSQQNVQTTYSQSHQQDVKLKNQDKDQIQLSQIQCDILNILKVSATQANTFISSLSKVEDLEQNQQQIIKDLRDTIEALNEKLKSCCRKNEEQ